MYFHAVQDSRSPQKYTNSNVLRKYTGLKSNNKSSLETRFNVIRKLLSHIYLWEWISSSKMLSSQCCILPISGQKYIGRIIYCEKILFIGMIADDKSDSFHRGLGSLLFFNYLFLYFNDLIYSVVIPQIIHIHIVFENRYHKITKKLHHCYRVNFVHPLSLLLLPKQGGFA